MQSKVDPAEMADSILGSIVRMARAGKLNIEVTDVKLSLPLADSQTAFAIDHSGSNRASRFPIN